MRSPLSKRFSERNPRMIGAIALVLFAVVVTGVLRVNALVGLFGDHYTAIVPEGAGLAAGSPVEVSGVTVGRVTKVSLAPHGVRVDFTVTDGDVRLGSDTSAAIKVATVLGDKDLTLTSAGGGELASGATIPLSRTSSPYDLDDVLSTLTDKSAALDTQRVSKALDVISSTAAASGPQLHDALKGVQRISAVINSRDQALVELASHADRFTGVLADRSDQLKRIFDDGNLLFAEIDRREKSIDKLLDSIEPFTSELRGLVDDNQGDLKPALDRLRHVTRILIENRDNLRHAIHGVATYGSALGEAVSSGNFFTAIIQNLIPGNLVPVPSLPPLPIPSVTLPPLPIPSVTLPPLPIPSVTLPALPYPKGGHR